MASRNDYQIRFPATLIDDGTFARIGPFAVAVYLVLLKHADERGECWPSLIRVSKLSGVCRRHVVTCIKKLADAGLIETVDSDRPSNTYIVKTASAPHAPPSAPRAPRASAPHAPPSAPRAPRASAPHAPPRCTTCTSDGAPHAPEQLTNEHIPLNYSQRGAGNAASLASKFLSASRRTPKENAKQVEATMNDLLAHGLKVNEIEAEIGKFTSEWSSALYSRLMSQRKGRNGSSTLQRTAARWAANGELDQEHPGSAANTRT
jgi:hypothetical protein